MSTQTATQTASRGQGTRGGNRGKGRGGRGGRGGNRGNRQVTNGGEQRPAQTAQTIQTLPEATAAVSLNESEVANDDDAASVQTSPEMCWICAEPVKYYSVPPCNHRTCHVCALRLRALYKKTECTFCKDVQSSLIFTVSPDALFSSFTSDSIPFKDPLLEIYFETEDMMQETLILLRFNCPDPDCSYIGAGWGDLSIHIRGIHKKNLCNLCVRSKKVFAHEHYLYTRNELAVHLPSMLSRHSSKQSSKAQIEGGIHPLCEFCNECFFSDDELYAHLREHHEECFVCKRNGVVHQYFRNYPELENHFNTGHHPCENAECLARKFVVFNTRLDLQGHMVEEHGAQMNTRDKKEARRVEADFEFEAIDRGGRGGRRAREPEGNRDPPPAPPGPPRPPGPSRRREAFGGNLTSGAPNNNGKAPADRASTSSGSSVGEDGVNGTPAYISRIKVLAANPANAVRAMKVATRSYTNNECGARDLILTTWNVLDRDLERTSSVINAFVETLTDEEKKQDLLGKWKGFEIEQKREFPELTPVAVGGGYAAITSGRVINAKHQTATRSAQRSSRQVWDRVAQAASSSSRPARPQVAQDRFPALGSSSAAMNIAAPAPIPPFRQGQRNTPWSTNGGASGSRPPSTTIVPRPSSQNVSSNAKRAPPPKLSESTFPGLPSNNNGRQKPQVSGNVSLKNILGNQGPATPAWGSGSSTPSPAPNGGVSADAAGGGKGKKGKGKQKQTLFTLGTFPA